MVHLHWLKAQGWGGFDTLARSTPDAKSGGTFRFTIKPGAHEGLDAYSLLVGLSPNGQWDSNVRNATLRIPSGKPAAAMPSRFPGPHDTENNSFLVEAVFRSDASKGGSVLVSCLGERGYELGVDAAGAIQFRVKADAEATVVSPASVADGRWHHVIAECDRTAGALRLYLDGRRIAEKSAALRAPPAAMANCAWGGCGLRRGLSADWFPHRPRHLPIQPRSRALQQFDGPSSATSPAASRPPRAGAIDAVK